MFVDLNEMLIYQSEKQPNADAYIFINENNTALTESITYAKLCDQAKAIAATLQNELTPGARVLLLYQPGIEFISAFFGCLMANVIAVPVYLPRIEAGEPSVFHLKNIVKDAGITGLLTCANLKNRAEILINYCDSPLFVFTTDTILLSDSKQWQKQTIDSQQLAFLQYTSGSLSKPKGVMLSHANLLANLKQISQSFNMNPKSKGLIWLPPYHDMGLIGGILAPIYNGFPVILMAPYTFIKNPLIWLKMISKYKATISGGPNFAFELCTKRMLAHPLSELDLSSWEVAFCGAESINPKTINEFTKTFSPYGFRSKTLRPCYGLAESCLLVSIKQKKNGKIVTNFSAADLQNNKVKRINSNNSIITQALVSCGEIIPEHELQIVNAKTHQQLAPGNVGEVWVRGPSVAMGYYNQPNKTKKTFTGSIKGQQGKWLKTGDLGFIYQNELYITGRQKELIIAYGKNYYPQDIEMAAKNAHNALRGTAAVFVDKKSNQEQIILVQEIKKKTTEINYSQLIIQIKQAILSALGLAIYKIILVKAGSIPRTTSGKIQRLKCYKLYLNHRLPILFLNEEEKTDTSLANGQNYDAAFYLKTKIAALTGIALPKIDLNNRFNDFGLDSIQLMELKNAFEEHYNCHLNIHEFLENQTIAEFIERFTQSQNGGHSLTVHSKQLKQGQTLPTTIGQRELYFAYLLNKDNNAYYLARAFKLLGNLDIDIFSAAVKLVIASHENLRSTFHQENEEIIQKVHLGLLPQTLSITTTDKKHIQDLLRQHSQPRFDLSDSALLRFHIYKLSANETVILFLVHHLIIDLWSINMLFSELESAYKSLIANKQLNNTRATPHEDYVNWYAQYLTSANYSHDAQFWFKHLDNYPKTIDFPIKNKGVKQTNVFHFNISEMDKQIVHMLARDNHTTVYAVMLCLFQIILFEYSGQSDIITGIPVALRNWRGANNYCGYCVNILPIRINFNDDVEVKVLIKNVHVLTRHIISHSAFPFTDLINHFMPARQGNQIPFFNTLFIYQNSHLQNDHNITEFTLNKRDVSGKLFDMEVQGIELPTAPILTDLNLTVTPAIEGFACSIEYQAEKFNPDDIEVLSRKYLSLITKLKFSQNIKLSQFANFTSVPQLAVNTNPLQTKLPHINHFSTIKYRQWQRVSNNLNHSKIDITFFIVSIFAKVINYWSSSKHFTFLLNSFSQESTFENLVIGKTINNLSIEVNQKWENKTISVYTDELLPQMNSHHAEIAVKKEDLITHFNTTWQSNHLAKHFSIILYCMQQSEIAFCPSPFIANSNTSLACFIWISQSQFNIQWSFPENLYPLNYIEALMEAFTETLKKIASDYTLTTKEIDLLPKSQHKSRTKYNATATQLIAPTRLENLFLQSALLYPEHIAIATQHLQMTYAELQQHVCRLSHYLLSQPYKNNQPIAIIFEKSWEQIAACLGTMAAGFAYLPINANLPINQVAEILKISEVELILTHSDLLTKLEPLATNMLPLNIAFTSELLQYNNHPPARRFSVNDLAYIIFTSGSTGTPKGVMIEHAKAFNTIYDMNSRFKVTSHDLIFGLSNLTFDLSVYDIFGTFAAGATLVLPDEQHLKNPAHWLALIRKYHVTIWNSVPLLLQMLLEYSESVNLTTQNPLFSLRLCLLSGDWVPLNLWEKLQKISSLKAISLGGATECSIWSNFYEEKNLLANWNSVPYGIPLANQQLYVYDKSLNPCPDWVIGDLYIGGQGLARGYWQDTEKTNAAFIHHPKTQERIYRTGDLARYRDGLIEFIGRNDNQIKLNGFRIELNEIQIALKNHPAIKDAIVMPWKYQDSDVLVAYVIVDSAITEFPSATMERTLKLRDFLSTYLQEYKIPQSFVYLDSFPLSINGKLSKEQLPHPEFNRPNQKVSITTLNDEYQIRLSQLWNDVLNTEVKYSEDNFFELGGNSLLAVRLVNRISTEFNIKIDVINIFENQTITKLTDFIKQAPGCETFTTLRALPRVLHKLEVSI